MVDLEWNRKTIFEKLDWLKETLEDVIAKANHNIAVQQEQLKATTARITALEKPVRKSLPVPTAKTKKPIRPQVRRTNRPLPPKRKR